MKQKPPPVVPPWGTEKPGYELVAVFGVPTLPSTGWGYGSCRNAKSASATRWGAVTSAR